MAPYIQQRITVSVYGFTEINAGSTEFTWTKWANLLTMLQQRKEMCVNVGVWLLTKRSSFFIRTKLTWNIQGLSHVTLTDPSESPQSGNPEKNTNMFAFITRNQEGFPRKCGTRPCGDKWIEMMVGIFPNFPTHRVQQGLLPLYDSVTTGCNALTGLDVFVKLRLLVLKIQTHINRF